LNITRSKNYPKDNFNLEYLAKFTKWFKNIFTIESSDQVIINKETLLKRIAEKKIYDYRELVILYVAILRGIGLHCRLVVSLNPPLVKSFNELLPKTSTVKKENKIKEEAKETKTKRTSSKEDKKNVDSKKNLKSNSIIQNNESARKNANVEAKKRAAEILRSKYSYNKKNKDKLNSNRSTQDNVSTSKNVEASTSSKKVESSPSPRRLRSRKVYDVASTSTKQQDKIISENNQSKTRKKQSRSNSSSSEEEEELPRKSKRKCSNKTAIKSKGKNEKKEKDQTSTDDEDNKSKKKQDVWAEVYVESKASWICVNVVDGNVDCVAEIYVGNL